MYWIKKLLKVFVSLFSPLPHPYACTRSSSLILWTQNGQSKRGETGRFSSSFWPIIIVRAIPGRLARFYIAEELVALLRGQDLPLGLAGQCRRLRPRAEWGGGGVHARDRRGSLGLHTLCRQFLLWGRRLFLGGPRAFLLRLEASDGASLEPG